MAVHRITLNRLRLPSVAESAFTLAPASKSADQTPGLEAAPKVITTLRRMNHLAAPIDRSPE